MGRRGRLRVKTISRDEEEFTRERKRDVVRVVRSTDASLHPHSQGREYTRALNAVKWERIFSKPFVAALDGHRDGVYSLSTLQDSLTRVVSGSNDGEVRVWDLVRKHTVWSAPGHTGFVRGITSDQFGTHFMTCGADKTVKIWPVEPSVTAGDVVRDTARFERKELFGLALDERDDSSLARMRVSPLATYTSTEPFSSIHHHYDQGRFVTGGLTVSVWDETKSQPLHKYQWGADSILTVRYNHVEKQVVLSTGSDRTLVLYDVRSKTPSRKVITHMPCGCASWNPQNAYTFVVGSEDKNAYTFDMRKLKVPVTMHRDHVGAIMSVDFAPTGREFVTGSFDKSVRIFGAEAGHSREVYHTQRMQRVFSVAFTRDNKYILSGSDDFNVRIWKTRADDRLRTLLPREQRRSNYNRTLIRKFINAPEIRRIARHRNVPKRILKMRQLRHTREQAALRKEARARANNPKAVPYVSDKGRRVVEEVE